MGANVLGLADVAYDELRPELRASLTEYYRVSNMHNYDELLRAMGYFTHRYGKLDRIDSQNEYWLETEARLRTDFNIQGFKLDEVAKIKRKSEMKKVFIKAGLPVARGKVVKNIKDALKFISETGYPVIAKPDIGVGANKTYKIQSQTELEYFFKNKPSADYIMEEFIPGIIQTFDGLTDQDGNIVFYSSLEYQGGVMDAVLQDLDFFYYSLRDIPPDLEEAGRKIINMYKIRERFFHFEFFRTPDNQLITLEVNMRPPGGLTTDMFNYANDIDIYREWANVVINNRFDAVITRPYYCCYIGRKWNKTYTHSHSDIVETFPAQVIHHEPISGVFAAALGDYGYLVRSPDLDEIMGIVFFALEKQQ